MIVRRVAVIVVSGLLVAIAGLSFPRASAPRMPIARYTSIARAKCADAAAAGRPCDQAADEVSPPGYSCQTAQVGDLSDSRCVR